MKKLALFGLLFAFSLGAQGVQPPIDPEPPAVWTKFTSEHSPGKRFSLATYDSVQREVLLIGGQLDNGTGWGEWVNDVWHWNGADWYEGTPSPPAKPPKAYSNVVFMPSIKGALEYGGVNCWPCGGQSTREAWLYDRSTGIPNSEIWSMVARPGCAAERHQFAIAYDANRKVVVVFGGISWDEEQNDTWELDEWGEAWKPAEVMGASPPKRYDHQMVYDSARQRIVMFGGRLRSSHQSAQEWNVLADEKGMAYPPTIINMAEGRAPEYILYTDTWVLEPYIGPGRSRWTQQAIPGPGERFAHGMAYDYKRRKVILFGGNCGYCPTRWLDDTWEYNGTKWKQRTGTPHPSARSLPGMASSHDGVWLYGGYRGFSVFYEDMWRYGN